MQTIITNINYIWKFIPQHLYQEQNIIIVQNSYMQNILTTKSLTLQFRLLKRAELSTSPAILAAATWLLFLKTYKATWI